jgi:hypothetical protein
VKSKRKVCTKCRKLKYISQFGTRNASPDKLQYQCNPCRYIHQKLRRQDRRAAVNEWKEERGCDECGYNKHGAVLDYHHKDPTTKISNVSDLIGRNGTWTQIKEEIAKCTLLCANCHRIKEYGLS